MLRRWSEHQRTTHRHNELHKEQTEKQLITELQQQYPAIRYVIGHRDTSPDLNGNGHIEPEEYIKACPCFDVRKWLKETEVMV